MTRIHIAAVASVLLLIAVTPIYGDAFLPFSPGMLDVRNQHDTNFRQINAALWTPMLRGGLGVINPDEGGAVKYGSFFVNTHPLIKSYSYAILMHGVLENPFGKLSESQGELRWHIKGANYLSLGIGSWEHFSHDRSHFIKLGYRKEGRNSTHIFSAIMNEDAGRRHPGLAFATHNKEWFLGGEVNAESRRLAFGYSAGEYSTSLRPAFEIIFFDRTPSKIDGQIYFSIAFTISYQGQGYLSHTSRMGRALGPTGMEFGNPNGFLIPNWNRRADTWEIGRLLNFWYREFQFTSGASAQRDSDMLLYPFHMDKQSNTLDGLLLGIGWRERNNDESIFPIAGYVYSAHRFNLKAIWEMDKQTRIITTLQIYLKPSKMN